MKMSDFRGTLTNRVPLIVGSGPTYCITQDVSAWRAGPVILVNDAIKLAGTLDVPPERLFLTTLHLEVFAPLMLATRGICFVPEQHAGDWFRPARLLAYDAYFPPSGRLPIGKLGRMVGQAGDRERLLRDNRLWSLWHSVLPAITMAWLFGASMVAFAGCGPIDGKFVSHHNAMLGGVDNPDPAGCYRGIEQVCRALGLHSRHLWTTNPCSR